MSDSYVRERERLDAAHWAVETFLREHPDFLSLEQEWRALNDVVNEAYSALAEAKRTSHLLRWG